MADGLTAGAPAPDHLTVCAVTVTHHPEASWPDRLRAAAAEAAGVVVVDNGSSDSEFEGVAAAAASVGARVLRNERNRGTAAAFNRGVRCAFDDGFAFALLLDQDTHPLPGLASELVRVYLLALSEAPTAVVGSNFVDAPRGRLRITPGSDAGGWTRRRTVIASGSLVERVAWERVGPFREEFFVDSVDHEFCLRARASGLAVVLALRPLIRHTIGRASLRRFAGIRLVSSNHPPGRRYWMARNRLVLAREYLLREPVWTVASLLSLVREAAVLVLVEERAGEKIRAMLRGTRDGLLGRVGPRSGTGDR